MGKPFSIFLFFALSTVALIVMQPGPRNANDLFEQNVLAATRNDQSILRPQPQDAPLPVPDAVISKIKQTAGTPVQAEQSFNVAPTLGAQTAALTDFAPNTVHSAPPPKPAFLLEAATSQPKVDLGQAPSARPAPAELRDMSWSALGTLRQIGSQSQTPGSEGSLINSIVRRSMAYVDEPVQQSAPQPSFLQPETGAKPALAPVRQTARLEPQAPTSPAPKLGQFGPRQSYTVVSGDNLALIAIKLYGSALQTDRLLQDNPALRSDPNSLRIGQVISYRAN